jgi:hypothetical protein
VTRAHVVDVWDLTNYLHRSEWSGDSAGLITSTNCAVADVFGPYTFVSAWGAPNRILRTADTALATPFIVPFTAGGVPSRLDTDGVDMVWLEGHDQTDVVEFGSIDIVASAYAERAEDLRPRLLGTFPESTAPPLSVGYGHVLLGLGSTVQLMRLSDGRTTRIDLPADLVWSRERALYVGPEELAFVLSNPRSPLESLIRFVTYAPLETP